jgi:hypothetical protein
MQTPHEPEKTFHCEKTNRGVPLSQPRCLDPKNYCRFRSACPIHALQRTFGREAA